MADLDKNRHDFLQTLQSFDSKLKPDIVLINESTKDIIIGELTCPMEAHDITKTKKYHDLANRIAENGFTVRFFAFEVGCRGLVGKSLRKFLTALELPKKIIKETLTDCAITALKCSRKIFLSPISNHHVNQRTSSWNADKRQLFEKKYFFSQINIDSSLSLSWKNIFTHFKKFYFNYLMPTLYQIPKAGL
jgi:hypothetical protein